MLQSTKYVYQTKVVGVDKKMLIDSTLANAGKIAPRKYYGADAQMKFKHKYGVTELRAEFVFGTQTGTENSSEPPAALLAGAEGYYDRVFNEKTQLTGYTGDAKDDVFTCRLQFRF